MSGYEILGQRMPRHNAVQQAAGKLAFGDDLQRPDMLYAKALFSAEAHARIVSIDISEAELMEGVRAIITAKDVPNNRFGLSHKDQPVLADDKVRYRGDALAVVAAETKEQAELAVKKIKVKYEVLPAVFDPIEAMKQDAPLVHGKSNIAHRVHISDGDVEKGFAESDQVIEEVFKTQKVIHAQIEPHVAMAELDYDDKIIVWSSNSRPFHYATNFARVMQLPMTDFQIKTPGVGGGFGSKNEIVIEPWVALLARKTKRPVKMMFNREEEFLATSVRHPYTMTYKTGLKNDGTIIARKVTIVSDSGAYVGYGEASITKGSIHCMGPYNIPNMEVESYLVYTNSAVGGAMRGFGVPQVCFAYEAHTDSIARKLGIDPVEFRLKNMFYEQGLMPSRQVVKSIPLRETFNRALQLAEGVLNEKTR